MFMSMADVRTANRLSGYHFFDRDTMRFFHSKVESSLYGGRYFVTSEQFIDIEGNASPRAYTIRYAENDGRITTVGDFQGYSTCDAARTEARRLAREAKS